MAYQLTFTATGGGNTRTITLTDTSVYSGFGHVHSDFYYTYIIQVLDSSGTELDVLSKLTGFTLGITTPLETDPANPVNTYVVTEDGRYEFNILAVPQYYSLAPYTYSSSDPVYVYDETDGSIYKLLQDATGQLPSTSPTYWEEVIAVDVTDMESVFAVIPSKYQTTVHQYSSISAEEVWADMLYRTHVEQGVVGDDAITMLNNREWKEAAQLFLDLRALPGDLTNENYESIDGTFTRSAALITKYS